MLSAAPQHSALLTHLALPAAVTLLPRRMQLGYYAALVEDNSFSKTGQAASVLFRPLGGFEAGIAALLVAVKQLIPDNEVALLGGALRFRAKVGAADGWPLLLLLGWRGGQRAGHQPFPHTAAMKPCCVRTFCAAGLSHLTDPTSPSLHP